MTKEKKWEDVVFDDIKAGDIIRRTQSGGGITMTRTGKAHTLQELVWCSKEGGVVADYKNYAKEDLTRKIAKVKLPKRLGAVVSIYRPTYGVEHIFVLADQDGSMEWTHDSDWYSHYEIKEMMKHGKFTILSKGIKNG
jgi:hypothetical protein